MWKNKFEQKSEKEFLSTPDARYKTTLELLPKCTLYKRGTGFIELAELFSDSPVHFFKIINECLKLWGQRDISAHEAETITEQFQKFDIQLSPFKTVSELSQQVEDQLSKLQEAKQQQPSSRNTGILSVR